MRTKRVRKPFVATFATVATLAASSFGVACSSKDGSSSQPPLDDSSTDDASSIDGAIDGAADAVADVSSSEVDTAASDASPSDAPPLDGEVGGDSALVNPSDCPKTAPILESKCTAAATSVCTYPDPCPDRPKGTDTYSLLCHLQKWELTTPTYEAKCPLDVPDEDGSCLCGAHISKACAYDICDVEGDPDLLALCDEKSATWLILVQSCNPPPPDYDAGPTDAVTDATDAVTDAIDDAGASDGATDAGSD